MIAAMSAVDLGPAIQVGRRRVPMYAYDEMDVSYGWLPGKYICHGRIEARVVHACNALFESANPLDTGKESSSKNHCCRRFMMANQMSF